MRAQNFLMRLLRLSAGIILVLGLTGPRAAAQSQPQGSIPSESNTIDSGSWEIDSGKIEEYVPRFSVVLKSLPTDPDSTVFEDPELVHGPLQTRWNGMPVVLLFFKVKVKTTERKLAHRNGPQDTVSFYMERNDWGSVKGYVFVPGSKKGKYRPIFVGDILPDPEDPKIEAAFFANADKDKAKELLVIS